MQFALFDEQREGKEGGRKGRGSESLLLEAAI
jgi:hypothetical protein